MKIITADIPQETYDFLNKYGTDGGIVEKAVINGTPILDNATNGDMIKAMFNIKDNQIVIDEEVVHVYANGWWLHFDYEDWWNAPYKGVE